VKPAGAALDYELLDLGVGFAYDINATGVIVGGDDYLNGHAIIIENGVRRVLPSLPGTIRSVAKAINAKGEIAGMAETADGNHLVRWRDGLVEDLGLLSGVDPRSINNNGQIVGAANHPRNDGSLQAFSWKDGTLTLLDLAPGKTMILTDVNDSGTAVGLEGQTDGSGSHNGFAWANVVRSELGRFVPLSINDQGDMAGYLDGHGTLLFGGTQIDIDNLTSGHLFAMYSINAKRLAVGRAIFSSNAFEVVVYADGIVYPLRILLDEPIPARFVDWLTISENGSIVGNESVPGGFRIYLARRK
jgi:probable HAF family extracellular repeat protein